MARIPHTPRIIRNRLRQEPSHDRLYPQRLHLPLFCARRSRQQRNMRRRGRRHEAQRPNSLRVRDGEVLRHCAAVGGAVDVGDGDLQRVQEQREVGDEVLEGLRERGAAGKAVAAEVVGQDAGAGVAREGGDDAIEHVAVHGEGVEEDYGRATCGIRAIFGVADECVVVVEADDVL